MLAIESNGVAKNWGESIAVNSESFRVEEVFSAFGGGT
jgi:hypothetical protein